MGIQDQCIYEVRSTDNVSGEDECIDYSLTLEEAAAHLDTQPEGCMYYIIKMTEGV